MLFDIVVIHEVQNLAVGEIWIPLGAVGRVKISQAALFGKRERMVVTSSPFLLPVQHLRFKS